VGFLSRLRSDDEQRSLPAPENELPWLPGLYTGATNITPAAALAIGDVWACIRVLADAASSLPLHVYRKTTNGRERVTSGKLVDLLDQPSPGTTQADLVSTATAHLLLHGRAYLGKYREASEISQLALLQPERMRPEIVGGEVRFRYSPGTGPERMLSLADVVPVRGLSVDGLHGLSAVQQAARVLGLSDELVKHALAFFDTRDTGGIPTPAGVLRVNTGTSFGGEERGKEKLRAESRPHGILVIEGEDAEYLSVASKLDDSQFVEQRRLAAQEVARVFRIPPSMIGAGSGGDAMTYTTVEQQSLDFVRYSLAPWLRRLELAISGDPDLASARQFVKFEIDALLRPDSAGRAAFYTAALDPLTGWMTRDEVRRLEDLEPEPEPTPAQAMTQAVAAAMTNGASNG
jgi:HK97 family phage portal protein